MKIHVVNRGIHGHKKRKRLGRGPGSGQGKTAGRGHKGAGSRAGNSQHPTFQGGTMPLVRRVPKRGFNNRWALQVAVINVGQLDANYEAGELVTLESLSDKNLARGRFDVLKVLGDGELTKKLRVQAHRFSKSAVEKIQQSGGELIVLPAKTPVEEKKRQQRQPSK